MEKYVVLIGLICVLIEPSYGDALWAVQPLARSSPCMVTDSADHRIILHGGDDRNWVGYYNDVWSFDLNEKTWSLIEPAGQPPNPRTWCATAAAYDPNADRLIVFGGWYGGTYYNDVWELDLTLGSEVWQELIPAGTSPDPRQTSAIVDPVNNRYIIFGGRDQSYSARNDLWEIDLDSLVWHQLTPSGSPPPIRYAHTAIYDPVSHRMIVFAGVAPYSSSYNDVWALDLTSGSENWQQLTPSGTPPPGRNMHFGVYNNVTREMIIGFGYDYPGAFIYYDDVWALNLNTMTWREVLYSGNTVFARREAFAAFDSYTNTTYIYGGNQSSHTLSDMYALVVDSVAVMEHNKSHKNASHYLTIISNPNRPPIRMNIALPHTVRVTLKVIDSTGRVVSTLIQNEQYTESHVVEWNGKDNRKRTVPTGNYFLVMEIEGKTVSKKGVLIE